MSNSFLSDASKLMTSDGFVFVFFCAEKKIVSRETNF